jgi:hypothetical protein
MDSTWISATAVSIAVPLVFAALGRLYPAPPAPELDRSLADLTREYWKWEALCLPIFFAVAPVAGWLWWQIFLGLAGDPGFSAEGGVHALRPSPISWLIPAMFLGMLSAAPVLEGILRWLLKGRYREYVAYQNRRHGFDSEAIEKPFYLGVGGLSAIAACLIGNYYVLFTPNEIRINPLLGLRERVFAYEDVVAIHTAPALVAPNGDTVARREYAVHFSDSTLWNTNWDPSDATDEQVVSVVRAISERSGVPISELPVLGRDEF